ncbi:phospholipid-transporting ATPase ABCA1-like isoform X2 [Ambystoma mexicanum]|uniref:phospholipid-transporting ATPase ABCA1-like isoform X2 n=1 Tax=Ambystoma mexicanum TaxID=8296 RepID=UPI0037E7C1AA
MGFWNQLGLLLWKNFTIRKRQKIRLLVELLWPLFLFFILVWVRSTNPPVNEDKCHYRNKAMPSAGLLPWIQTILCNVNNPCLNYPTPGEAPGQVNNFDRSLLSTILKDLQNVVSNPSSVSLYQNVWKEFNDWIQLLEEANQTTGRMVPVKDILKNNETFTPYLRDSLNIPVSVIASIMSAYIIPQKVMVSSNNMSFKDIVCNTSELLSYVTFNSSKDQDAFQNLSCSLPLEKTKMAANAFLSNIDALKLLMVVPDALGANPTRKKQLLYSTMKDVQAIIQQMPVLKSIDAMKPSNSSGQLPPGNTFADIMASMNMILCGSSGKTGSEMRSTSVNSRTSNNVSSTASNVTGDFCQSLITTMENTTSLKFLWSTFRPLLMGKVLYTPDNPATRQIVKEANRTFWELGKLKDFGEAWEVYGPIIWQFLQNSPQMNQFREMLKNPVLSALIDIQLNGTGWTAKSIANYLYNGPPEMRPSGASTYDWRDSYNYSTNAIRTMSKFLGCLTLDKFEPAATEWALVNRSLQLIGQKKFWAALVFQNMENATNDIPTHIKYKLRMDIDQVQQTQKIKERLWAPGAADDANKDLRYLWGGFAYIQDMIDHGIIRLHSNKSDLLGVFIQQMPYPCYVNDVFTQYIGNILPMFLTLAFIFSVCMIIKGLVHEKEMRLKEVMRMVGVKNSIIWLTWFLDNMALLLVSSALLSVLVKFGNVLRYSDPSVFFVFMVVFCFSTIMECFLISVFFSKANLAAACGGIIYFVLYLPHVLLFAWQDYLTFPIKLVVSLFSTVAFGFGCENFSRWEQQGIGLTWSNIRSSPVDGERYSFAVSMVMMLFDGVLYLLLTCYIENVFPGQYGIPRPWYYPFTASYWCGTNARRKNEVDAVASESDFINNVNFEAEPTHLAQGVSIKNLVKVYKTGKKLAVDGLSLNFYEGQITSFLGHNGAGKTTTMSILTGLFPPSSGTAVIYGRDIQTDMDQIRQDMGMCPQHNVLFDQLTVEEHIYFYARLKGCKSTQRKKDIDCMIEDIGLPHKRKEMVKNLSGGMQRKLSIAIAFVGGSKVVILDEPTAGVDPYARRGIWELLLKFKQGRTIILSTHHMDEADILGDRIAIISHGKLCCCGSSMFLKKCFGSGYFLTLVKAANVSNDVLPEAQARLIKEEDGLSHGSSEDEGIGSESGNKDELQDVRPITSLIHKHVPQAELVEDIGQEITYLLPYKGAQDGTFVHLFKELDLELSTLGISSYGVSDTTLEEIFLKVAEETGVDKEIIAAKEPFIRDWKRSSRESKRSSISRVKNNPELLKAKAEKGSMEGLQGKGSYVVSGWRLIYRQFLALFLKRFHHARRSRKGFVAQVIQPAAFVCLALIFSMVIPPFVEYPNLELQPWMYGSQRVFYSNDEPTNVQVSQVTESLTDSPGFGTRCMKNDPIPNLPCTTSGTGWYTPSVPESVSEIFRNGNWSMQNPSPSCACSTPQRMIMLPDCPPGAGGLPPAEKLHNTTDTIENLTERNISDYVLKTYQKFYKVRYGGLSVGDVNSQVQMNSSEISDLVDEMKVMFNTSLTNETAQTWKDVEMFMKELGTKYNMKVWFYNPGWHAVVSFINVANNAILRGNLPEGKSVRDYGITTYNHPLNLTKEQMSDFASSSTDMIVSICVIFAMSFIPASFVLFLIQERVTKAKHLQFVSGVNPAIYWLANFSWDMCNYLVPCIIVIVLFLCFQQQAYVSAANLPVLILLLILYGWSITPLMYPASFLFSIPSTAYVVLTCINLFIGINGSVATFVLEMFKDENLNNINEILKKILLVFPHFCLGRGLIDMAKNQAIATAYYRFGEDRFENPFKWELVGKNLFAMFVEGIGFFLFTLLLQYNFFIRARPVKLDSLPVMEEDQDVSQERARILSGGGQSDLLRICELTKIYRKKKKPAVCRICVGVPPAECFGLLGINGAGKTTTFKMLTGDISVSGGDAVINGYSILTHMREVHQNMGYCPQFDAIDDLLNGREHLEFYARLRGVPEEDVRKVAEWGIQKLGLVKYASKSAGTYSGGNKRKLSTAMALIGCPAIIFLDEPTTGMDPKARRFLWDCILSIIREGRSVILTSHSMEECEALCTRMAIMVNGQFRCLGSIQHLKNRFGEGYTVIVRVAGLPPKLQPVEDFVEASFPGSVLKEKHHNTLQYQLPSGIISLSAIFSAFTENKEQLSIEDYSVSQTTLDQVFVNFAKHQNDEEMTRHGYTNPLDVEADEISAEKMKNIS